MRITLATGPMYPLPPVRGGAMAKMWWALAPEFARHGHDVTVLACRHPGMPAVERIGEVDFKRVGGFAQSGRIAVDLARDLVDAARVLAAAPPADWLITNDFWLPALAALRPSRGRIAISANRYPKRQFGLYRRAARVVAPTRAIAAAIAEQAPRLSDRLRVVGNTYDGAIAADDAVTRAADSVLYAGRVHPEKGVHLLIDAFRRLLDRHPAARLTIVGPNAAEQGGGGKDYLRQLQANAEGLPVRFVGAEFDPTRLAAHYAGHAVFAYPSLAERGETFGVAVIEAMASGAIPVVSALDCFADVVDALPTAVRFDHRGADPAADLADALDRGLTAAADPAMVAAVRDRARRYTAPVIAEAWLAALE